LTSSKTTQLTKKKYDDEIEKIMMELTKKPLDPLIV
jgi:hypothetical protein